MKFVISRDALLKPLNLVAGVVERRQTLPILANVLLVLDNDRLSLTGTDLEVELVGRVHLTTSGESGEITVPARKLVDICKSLPEGSADRSPLEVLAVPADIDLRVVPGELLLVAVVRLLLRDHVLGQIAALTAGLVRRGAKVDAVAAGAGPGRRRVSRRGGHGARSLQQFMALCKGCPELRSVVPT